MIGPGELVGSCRMATVKSATWKDAVGFFLILVALRGGWNLIKKHGESPLYILG